MRYYSVRNMQQHSLEQIDDCDLVSYWAYERVGWGLTWNWGIWVGWLGHFVLSQPQCYCLCNYGNKEEFVMSVPAN
jgi:hypothetical protein